MDASEQLSKDKQLTELQLESVYRLASLEFHSSSKPDIIDSATTFDDKLPSSLNGNVKLMDLFSWLNSLERQSQSEAVECGLQYINQLQVQREYCSNLCQSVEGLLGILSELGRNYTSVSEKTNSLHQDCQHLMAEQAEITGKADELEKALLYFTNVESVDQELNSSQFVTSAQRLSPLLDKLDQSIAFFQNHPEFKETPRYLTKAMQLLDRVNALIESGVGRLIERTINEVLDLQDAITPDNSFIMLYGRFRSQGPKIRSLVTLIEQRLGVSEEYGRALSQCQQAYIQRRQELVQPVIENGVNDLISRHGNDHCALLRTGGQFMLHACDDETRLFAQFFDLSFTNQLDQILTQFCRTFYDAFRPMIIHINHIELLAELSDILRYELEDNTTDGLESPAGNATGSPTAFTGLRSMLLSDVQHRLVFRAEVYIDEQIAGYQPGAGDLRYPEKLQMMQQIAQSINKDQQQQQQSATPPPPPAIERSSSSTSSDLASSDLIVQPGPNMSLAPADLHGMWYPSLRRTLVCLSKLSRCLGPDSFRGLAQYGTSRCIESLFHASNLIGQAKGKRDAQLFLVKHLLILREQMVPFNVDFSVKETSLDFSNYRDAAIGIWQRRGSGLLQLSRTNALLRLLLESPHVVEVELDSRQLLDVRLKQTCESLISDAVNEATGDLTQFLSKARSALTAPGIRLADQPFASPSELASLVSASHRRLTCTLAKTSKPNEPIKSLTHALTVYLANRDTESILMRRIEAGVLAVWQALTELIVDAYNAEDTMIIGCPTVSQIRLLFQQT